jgi:hypothetical protein
MHQRTEGFYRRTLINAAAAGWAVLLACCCSTLVSAAAFDDVLPTARARSLAGALTACGDTAETVTLQPAGLVDVSTPELSFTYGRLYAGLSDHSRIDDLSAACAVPCSPRLAVGAAYYRRSLDAAYREQAATIAAAWRPAPFVAVGAAVNYLQIGYGSDAYTAVDPLFSAGSNKTALDAAGGLLVRITERVTCGYSAQNLAQANIALRGTAVLPTVSRLGIAYREPAFLMTAEAERSHTRAAYRLAGEKFLARGLLACRLGILWGDHDRRMIAAGVGMKTDLLMIDYAWEYPLAGIERTSGTHYLTLTLRHLRKTPVASATAVAAPAAVVAGQPAAAVAVSSTTAPAILSEPLSAAATGYSAATSSAAVTTTYEVMLESSSAVPVPAALAETTATLKTSILQFLTVTSSTASAPIVTLPEHQPAKRVAPPKQPAVEKVLAPLLPAVYRHSLMHRVATDETLPALAERYYNDAAQWPRIYTANEDKIEKGSLQPGQLLIIPPAEDN